MTDLTLAKVRAATPKDIPQMTDLLNDIIRIGGTTAFQQELSEAEIAWKCLENPALICCHVAVDSAGDIAGFQYLGAHPKLPADVADIATFARQTPRVRGVGRALMDATQDAARAAGMTQINALIRADNVPGLAYYSKMGGHDVSIDRGVPLSDGTPVDRIAKRIAL